MERNFNDLITELENIGYVSNALSTLFLEDGTAPNSEITRRLFDDLSNHIGRIVEDLDKLNVPGTVISV